MLGGFLMPEHFDPLPPGSRGRYVVATLKTISGEGEFASHLRLAAMIGRQR